MGYVLLSSSIPRSNPGSLEHVQTIHSLFKPIQTPVVLRIVALEKKRGQIYFSDIGSS